MMRIRGVADAFGDDDSLKRAWSVVASFRQIHHEVVKGIADCLPLVLEFVPWSLGKEQQIMLWDALQLEKPIVDKLLSLSLRVEDGRLRVAPEWGSIGDAPQLIAATLLGIWRVAEWTESRWLPLARTCRRFLAARITGLHSIIEHLRRRPHFSQHYINGWDKLDGPTKHLFAVAGLAAGPSDFMLAEMFADDRLCIRMLQIDKGVHRLLTSLATLPDEVWNVLGSAVDHPSQGFRASVVGASLASACFAMWRLDRVRRPPFVLCGPAKETNLEALKAGDILTTTR